MWSTLHLGLEDISKRWWIIGIVLVGGALLTFAAVTHTVAAQGPSGSPVTDWEGMTSQGLPMSFVIEQDAGGARIKEFKFEFDLMCLTTGRIQRVGLGVGFSQGIQVNQGRWNYQSLSLSDFLVFAGAATSGSTTSGVFIDLVAAIASIQPLQLEVCWTEVVTWNAEIVALPASRTRRAVDREITVTVDESGQAHVETTGDGGGVVIGGRLNREALRGLIR